MSALPGLPQYVREQGKRARFVAYLSQDQVGQTRFELPVAVFGRPFDCLAQLVFRHRADISLLAL